MEKGQFFTYYSSAKQLSGFYKTFVEQAISEKSAENIKLLKNEIAKQLSNLGTSIGFFKSIGKKGEIDMLIIYYKTLLSRLNSP